jgi:hypothetical protein
MIMETGTCRREHREPGRSLYTRGVVRRTHNMRDLRKELSDWDGYPEAWRPEPGEILVGFVVGYDEGPTSYGPVRTVIIAREEDGQKVTVWLSSTVLLDLFQKQKPRPGERVGVRYLGRDKAKGYHKYHLVIDRPEPVELTPLGGEEVEDVTEDEVLPF